MVQLVQCVPNFSEGQRREVIEEILAAIGRVPGVKLIESGADPVHNRLVVGFLGSPSAVAEAAFAACAKATELIDMEKHRGQHPRMGATDVIPFVPVAGINLDQCVTLAHDLGERIAKELAIPIYYYEWAALRPERRNLASVRQGQYEGLKMEIGTALRQPDVGPPRMHPTAGATAVGARPPLIAFNVNLGTTDVEIAKGIAQAIRARNGGYTSVKAIGLPLPEEGLVQVSINMCDYRETPLHRVLETIKSEAGRYGVPVVGSEIVGTVPQEALMEVAVFYLQLNNFREEQVLENHLLDLGEGE